MFSSNHQHHQHFTGFWSCNTDFTTAIVKPLLKKPSLDQNVLKYYHSTSNLLFLSKILGKVVLHQLLAHLQENNLCNPFQSVYHTGHGTETCKWLAKCYGWRQNLCFTLTGSFSCVWYYRSPDSSFQFWNCLWHPLYHLQWFRSYHLDRNQSVVFNNFASSSSPLMFGVPQGSVLGPVLFILYTTPLSDIVANHPVNHQLFADDT